MIIANPTEGDQQNIIPNFKHDVVKLNYENMSVDAIVNYEEYLVHRYCSISFNRPSRVFEHTNAFNIKKVKNTTSRR